MTSLPPSQLRASRRRWAWTGLLSLPVLAWAPLARACPACAAGDTSAGVGDGWMVSILALPVLAILLAGALLWRIAAGEDARK